MLAFSKLQQQFYSPILNHLSLNNKFQSQMLTTKRPTCPSCSKPATICLCNRLPSPLPHNSVSVTILQHTLEKNHPLNSARIAKIGLKNVEIVSVSDVNFEAQFFIRPLHRQFCAFDFTIAKSGTCKMGMSFDELLASGGAVDEIRRGFVVKKVKHSEGRDEFETAVPCGSALLFPSESSVDAGSIDLEVKNLIVLDGTWAKAKRMYKENPWLRLLPHIRLDLDRDRVSLYNEVRTQPRAGYLSTIESIVYAMKAVGEDVDGLDGLLAVFQSMVDDQRRCKDERMSKPNS